jgi:transglutaminase-like putative cysteine protease
MVVRLIYGKDYFGPSAGMRLFSRDFAHLAIALARCMNIPARQATGGESIFVRTDVSQAEEVQALMARTVERVNPSVAFEEEPSGSAEITRFEEARG